MPETPEPLSPGWKHIIFWGCLFGPIALAALLVSVVPDLDRDPAPFFLWTILSLACSFASAFHLAVKCAKSLGLRIALTTAFFLGLFMLNLILFVIGCTAVHPMSFH